MPHVKAARSGAVRLDLDADEAGLVRKLCEELREVLGAPRSDPVIARLFPDVYEDPAEAEAFREMAGDELERQKLAAVDTVERALGRDGRASTVIAGDDLDAWLAFLTDLRLAIAVRLNADEELLSSDVDRRDPRAPALGVMHWLGWLQELLIEAATS